MKRDLPQLHTVRALAAAAIFLHHFHQGVRPPALIGPGTFVGALFAEFALGVAVFNVMTSLLAALPYALDPAKEPPKPLAALGDKLRRLCPHYWPAVLGVLVGNAAVYEVIRPGDWLPPLVKHVFFLDSFSVTSFFSNTAAYWWLGLLVQFTLAFPWLVRLVRKHGAARATLVATPICWGLTFILKAAGEANPGGFLADLAFLSSFNLPARAPEFLLGFWIAEEIANGPERPKTPGASPLAAALAGALLCSAPLLWGGNVLWCAGVAWTMVLFVALFHSGRIAVLGRYGRVRSLSAASYAIYLVHQPILSWIAPPLAGLGAWTRFGLTLVLGALATLAAAAALDWTAARIAARLHPSPPGGRRDA